MVPPVDQFIAVMVHSFCVTRVIMGQTFVVNSLLNGMFTKRLMHWAMSHWVISQVGHGSRGSSVSRGSLVTWVISHVAISREGHVGHVSHVGHKSHGS